MSYIVCHMDKYHRNEVAPIEGENERDETYKADNPDIDSSRTHNNYHIISPQGSYMDFINGRIATLTLKRKIRSDAVYMNSYILGSDKQFFENMPLWQQREFFEECVNFIANKFGRENIISAIVHMDETNPHMHLNIVPIVNGKLCSKDLYDKRKLSKLQTEIWAAVGQKYGLQRGKEGSQRKHKSTADFKADMIIQEAQQQAEHIKQQAEDFLSEVHGAVEEAQNKPVPKKKKEAAEEIIYLRTENTALKKHIEIKNRDSADLFNQMQEAQKRNDTAEAALGMVSDIMAVYPERFRQLLSESRQAKSAPPPSSSKANSFHK